MNNLPVITEFEQLSQTNQKQQLEFICDFSRSIFTLFYQSTETGGARALELETWIEHLKNFKTIELKAAWAKYRFLQIEKYGRLKFRPAPENISALIYKSRLKLKIVPTVEPEGEPRATKEQVAAIMEKLGVKFRKFGGVH